MLLCNVPLLGLIIFFLQFLLEDHICLELVRSFYLNLLELLLILSLMLADRYQQQIDAGFLAEVTALAELPVPLSTTASQALGYKELLAYLNGDCGLEEALENAIAATRRFARKQERWFRRDPRICWIDVEHDPLEALTEILEYFDRCALERETISHQSPYICETG